MFIDIFNTDKKYQIIYADPPWNFRVWSATTSQRPWHYPRMKIEDVKALPLPSLTAQDCFLFLWATSPNLLEAMGVIEAWGFTYKTIAFNWVKLNKNNMGFFIGMGYYTRQNTELCLLATKGHPRRVNSDVPQIIATPRMAHSRKPDEIVRDRIIRLCGDLPRVELFARRKVEGWDCWGDEVQ